MVRGRTWLNKMYAATSQSSLTDGSPELQKTVRVEGGAALRYTHGNLADLYHHDPVRVVFPTPLADDIPQSVIVTTSGGLTGGDHISIDVDLETKSRVLVAAQAAEKIYRSAGLNTRIDISLTAAEGCWLEYLPQETILFDGARLLRKTCLEIEQASSGLAGEMLVFGRRGSGEVFSDGYVKDAWEVRSADRLLWADTFLLEDDVTIPLHHPAALDGAISMATLVSWGEGVEDILEDVRDRLADQVEGLRASVSLVNGLLILRWLGQDSWVLRNAYGNMWKYLRQSNGALPARLPRLWEI